MYRSVKANLQQTGGKFRTRMEAVLAGPTNVEVGV